MGAADDEPEEASARHAGQTGLGQVGQLVEHGTGSHAGLGQVLAIRAYIWSYPTLGQTGRVPRPARNASARRWARSIAVGSSSSGWMVTAAPRRLPAVSGGGEPRLSSMARTIATNTAVDREQMLEFVRPRHHFVLLTYRRDGTCRAHRSPAGSTARAGW